MKFLAALLALTVLVQAAAPVLTNVESGPVEPPKEGAIRLKVTVDTMSLPTKLQYFFGISPNTAADGPTQQIPAMTAPQNAFIDVPNLVGGQTYRFKVTASNGPRAEDSDTEFGPDFTMPVVKPSIKLLTPETSPTGTATVKATIIANGADVTSVTFKGGLTTEYTDLAQFTMTPPTPPILGTDSDGDTVQHTFTNLTRGLTYRYQITATNSQGTGTSGDTGVFTVPANRAPIARPDTARLNGTKPITIDVLKNDSDPDGDGITLEEVTQGKQGRVQIVGGKILYTPAADANAGDTFTYVILDDYDNSVRSATGTVTISSPNLNSRGLGAAELKDEEGNVVGLIRLTGTGNGTVSGKLQLFTQRYTVMGQLDANGHFYFTIPRDEDGPLQLDVDFSGDEDGAFDVSLKGDGNVWSGEEIPNTLTDARRDEIVGKYTVELPAPSGDDQPKGIGFVRVDIKPWGDVSIKGRLGDGSKFSTKGVLTGSDSAPIVSMFTSKGDTRLRGTLQLGSDANLTGPFVWFRDADSDAMFPNGIYAEINMNGSRLEPAQKGQRTLPDAKKATITLTDGNLNTSITQSIEISKSDRVSFIGSNPFGVTMKIDRANGTFKGQFDHPFDDSRHKFLGVLLQAQDKGSGVFTGIDRTGAVALSIGVANPTPTPTPTPNPTPDPPNNGNEF
jgi:hypothetical protein